MSTLKNRFQAKKKIVLFRKWLPLIIVLSVALIFFTFAIVWFFQNRHAHAAMFDTPANNLLSNGSFENIDQTTGKITDWHVDTTGPSTHITSGPGYEGKRDIRVAVSNYQKGQVSIEHDKVSVPPNKDYFFKSYYLNTVDFDLLVHYFYADGTDKLAWVQHYPAVDQTWSTMSTTIHPGSNIKAVSFVVNIAGKGTVDLDGAYLIQSNDLYKHPDPRGTGNLIPNSSVQSADSINIPSDWLTYHVGNNQPVFAYNQTSKPHFISETVTNYKDGEAKWQYQPVAVTPGQYFNFSADYRSNTAVDLIAEYTMTDGTQDYSQLATLEPTSNTWTNYSTSFQAVPGSTDMFVSFVLHRNGTLDTTNYHLANITNGQLSFKQPLISLTFDDEWETQFTNALPVLNKYHLTGAFYINSGNVGKNNYMTFEQLQTLNKANFELAAHGDQHFDMTTLSVPFMHKELDLTKTYLQQKFNLGMLDYASPYGKHDAQTDEYESQQYASHRGTDSGINTKQNFDLYNLKVLFVRSDTKPALVQSYIDQAKANNGWLIIVYHEVGPGAGENIITAPMFDAHMAAIYQSGLPVVTVQQALKTLAPQLKQ